MSADWRDNIYFVLVEPKEPGNIGASARAIKNMGFKNLCLVNPKKAITDESRWLAHNAIDILESAKIYNTLEEVISDKSIVVGTTRRIGKRRGVILSVIDGLSQLYNIAISNKVAILFGREDKGLFNDEIEQCGYLLTIPTSKQQPSLNLAQAVLIIAYELSKLEFNNQAKQDIFLVDQKELNVLYERIFETLILLDYIPRGDVHIEKKIMQNIRHFIGRAGLTIWELKMLHGICSQVKKQISNLIQNKQNND